LPLQTVGNEAWQTPAQRIALANTTVANTTSKI